MSSVAIVTNYLLLIGRGHATISDRSHGNVNEKSSCDATIVELKRSHELEVKKLKEQIEVMVDNVSIYHYSLVLPTS